MKAVKPVLARPLEKEVPARVAHRIAGPTALNDLQFARQPVLTGEELFGADW
jgi:hypothetical protein